MMDIDGIAAFTSYFEDPAVAGPPPPPPNPMTTKQRKEAWRKKRQRENDEVYPSYSSNSPSYLYS